MHSSRMRTVRSSGRISGGVPGPGGCTWSWGVYLVPGGCTWSGGYLVWGVYLVPGGCTWSGTPPCGQTDACKNITFATSLRTGNYLHVAVLSIFRSGGSECLCHTSWVWTK